MQEPNLQTDNSPDYNISVGAKSASSSNKIVIVLLLIIVAAIAFLLLNQMRSNDDGDTNPEVTPTTVQTATPTQSVEPTVAASNTPVPTTIVDDVTKTVDLPANWKEIELGALGYTAYRPQTWYFRFFSGVTLGIDPNPIPEASGYAGTITVTKYSNKSLSSVLTSEKAGLEVISESEATYQNGTWTLINAERPATEAVDGQSVMQAYMEVSGTTYKVEHAYAIGGTATYATEFEIMTANLVF